MILFENLQEFASTYLQTCMTENRITRLKKTCQSMECHIDSRICIGLCDNYSAFAHGKVWTLVVDIAKIV